MSSEKASEKAREKASDKVTTPDTRDAGVAEARAADGASAPVAGPDAVPIRRSPEGASSRPRPPRREVDHVTRTGELAIIVLPWAMIWLNGKRSGQTPFRAAVPIGQYRVRLANDEIGQDEVTIVTVEPDKTETIERSW